ncbi:site-specific DNA-methyltransferase [Leptolyngbya sp. 7M]|uniref:site-specific DNA-methyltransferase n=1 Tax=Leptolyngbya sp. 7M TaxID=2812896 RepID=UPI001B8C78A8|nr:site-specific DNA-methyltransferase [Leptolyngbya sp. 7M]QYO65887.1 site-specific DNA-methyltransferase [Leptolyngbya sp. 7M]
MGELLTSNPKSSGRFHSDWLNMMYPRLRVAKDLLREDGVMFISIDDNEARNLRLLVDEIFGEENFISQIVIQSNKRGQTYKEIAKTHEYLLLHSLGEDYSIFELPKPDDSLPFEDSDGRFELWELRNRNPKFGRHNRPNLFYPIYVRPEVGPDGYAAISLKASTEFVKVEPFDSNGRESCWRWGRDTVQKAIEKGDSVLVAKQRRDGKWNIYEKSRKSTTSPKSLWTETDVISEQGTVELGELGMGKYFDHPKPLGLLDKVLRIATEQDDMVIDFFAGSGTLAHAVYALNAEDGGNRKAISVQIGEQISNGHAAYKDGFRKISDVTAERLRRASKAISEGGKRENADLGFRSYRLEKSNFKAWTDYQGNDLDELRGLLQAQLDSTFVDGATEDAILTEILLLEGFPLTSKIETDETFEKNIVRRISHEWSEHRLFVTLDKEIQEETIRKVDELIDSEEMSKIDIFICLDNALTDQDKLRLADVCRLKTI